MNNEQLPVSLICIDAFADRPFSGNPAAVCLLDRPAEAQWMQQLAAEINLSETAFVRPEGDGFELRWFTPTVEVNLCGHATLASACALWELDRVESSQPIEFYTKSGTLVARRQGDWIELDFPAKMVRETDPPPALLAALSVAPTFVGSDGTDYLLEVESEAIVGQLQPNFRQLATLPVRGIIVTSRSSPPYDFVSRFFAPGSGIDEDPVTGSAHCCLATFWQPRLNKSEFLAYQASPRGGTVRVKLVGDRVYLGGKAIPVWQGNLLVPLSS